MQIIIMICINLVTITARLTIDYRVGLHTLGFAPWLSDFKTKTSFGFLIPNYMGHVFWIF